jgi:hypothetical protein
VWNGFARATNVNQRPIRLGGSGASNRNLYATALRRSIENVEITPTRTAFQIVNDIVNLPPMLSHVHVT